MSKYELNDTKYLDVQLGLTGTYTSPSILKQNLSSLAIQAVLEGTFVAYVSVECSLDGGDFVTYEGSTTQITNTDTIIFELPALTSKYYRLKVIIESGSVDLAANYFLAENR